MEPTPGPAQPQYRLKACTDAELTAFNNEFRALIEKHGVEVRTAPTFVLETTTGKYVVDAQVVVFKKELVPQPQSNEGATQPTTEPGPEAAPVVQEAKSEVPQA